MQIQIEIEETVLVARVADQIRGSVFEEGDWEEVGPTGKRLSLENKVRKVIVDQVREATNVAVQRITEERIGAAVDACLAEGWRKTDGYGTSTGPTLTLKDRIGEILSKASDSYNRATIIDTAITKAIENTLSSDFAPILTAAKRKLSEMLDGIVLSKVAETMKAALGLKP